MSDIQSQHEDENTIYLKHPSSSKRIFLQLGQRICSNFYKCTLISNTGENYFQFFVKKRENYGLSRALKLNHDNLTLIRLYKLFEEEKMNVNGRPSTNISSSSNTSSTNKKKKKSFKNQKPKTSSASSLIGGKSCGGLGFGGGGKEFCYIVYEDDFCFETNLYEIYKSGSSSSNKKKINRHNHKGKMSSGILSELNLKFLIDEVLNGLNYIHQSSNVHGNISLKTILIGKDFKRVKIDTDIIHVNYNLPKNNIYNKDSMVYTNTNSNKNHNNQGQIDDIIDFGKCLKKLIISSTTSSITGENISNIDESFYSDELKEILKSLLRGDKNVIVDQEIFLKRINTLKDQIIQIIESFYSNYLKYKKRGVDFSEKFILLKDQLDHFEEICDKFHKLDLIKDIIKNVKSLFENEIAEFFKNKTEDFVEVEKQDEFVKTLLDTEQLKTYVKEFLSQIEIAVDRIIQYNRQMKFEPISPSTVSMTSSHEWEKILYSSNSQFLSPNIMKNFAMNLNIKNSLSIRLSAVEEFVQMNVSNILCSEHWEFILKQISYSLGDRNQKIVDKIFDLHVNLYKFSPPDQAMSVYLSLVDHLIWLFGSNSLQSFAKRISMKSSIFCNTMKKIKLLLWFQEDLRKWWLSFDRKTLQVYFDKTFKLLRIKIPNQFYSKKRRILDFPILYICLIDPTAKWFLKWVRDSNIRSKWTSKYSQLYVSLSKFILNSSLSDDESHKNMNVENVKLYYYLLIQSISIVGKVLTFNETNSFFTNQKERIITKIIEHVYNFFTKSSIFIQNDKKYYRMFFKVVSKAFSDFVHYSETKIFTVFHIKKLLYPLSVIYKNKKDYESYFNDDINQNVLYLIFQVLKLVCKNEKYKKLLFLKKKRLVASNEFKLLIKFIKFVLKLENVDKMIVQSCLILLRKLVKRIEFNYVLSKSFLSDPSFLENIKRLIPTEFEPECLKFYENFVLYMNGLIIINDEKEIITAIVKNILKKRIIKPKLFYLLSQLSLSKHGSNAIREHGLTIIFNDWKELKLNSFKWYPIEEKYKSIYCKNMFYLLMLLPLPFFDNQNKVIVDEIVEKMIFGKGLNDIEVLNFDIFRKFGIKIIFNNIKCINVFGYLTKNYDLINRLEKEKDTMIDIYVVSKNKLLNLSKKIIMEMNNFTITKKEEDTFQDGDIIDLILSNEEIHSSTFKKHFMEQIQKMENNDSTLLSKDIIDEFVISEFYNNEKKSESDDDDFLNTCFEDCFIGVMSKIFKEETYEVLERFAKLPHSCYLWYNRGKCIIIEENDASGNEIFYIIYQLIEVILRVEYPTVYNFYYRQGICPSIIIQKWISQSLLNFFNINEIYKIILFILLNDIDYLIYICISGLIYIKTKSIGLLKIQYKLTCLKGWKNCLKKLEDYKLSNYIEMFQKLEKKYRSFCLKRFNSIKYKKKKK